MDTNTNTTATRWTGKATGIPLANVTMERVDQAQLGAELERLTSDRELGAALAARAVYLSGVGLAVRLPYFKVPATAARFETVEWPAYEERAYPLAVAVDLCRGPESPLRELATRLEEASRWAAQEAAAAQARDERARAFREVTSGWEKIGPAARVFLRAAAALPAGAARDACLALASAAVEEKLATTGAPPAFDEQVNALIRAFGREIFDHEQQRHLRAAG